MSREKKFRAYSKTFNKMYFLDGFTMTKEGCGTCFFGGDGSFFTFGPNDVEITEYTGFRDKHGTDIYEGDLLRTQRLDGVIWECEFDKGFFGFRRIGFEKEGWYGFRSDLGIIGNIYENKELLNG